MNLDRRRFTALLLATAAAPPAEAQDVAARVTFVLTNDIYQMGDQEMPDGRRRGGFARLAAVVKAERARGGHVIFAHGGDTLSPSLMSGIDRGAHIVTLTNMIRPDIFAPGNHEFDFGKGTFLQRMAEARFPLFAANLRDASGAPIPGFQDRAILEAGGIRIGLTGAAYDETPRASSPEDLRFLASVPAVREQADALRREGAEFVVAVMHADRQQGIELMATRAADLILTGHNHDLYINYDGRTAMVESSYDGLFVTMIDVTFRKPGGDGRSRIVWTPEFRVVDTADVIPDPEVVAKVAEFEAELSGALDVPLATTAVELDSRNAAVRTREAAIGNLIADAMREMAQADAAIMNGGGIRAGKVYRPGSSITRRDVLAELPFGNRVVTLALSGRDLMRAMENGVSQLPAAAGRFPQVSGITLLYDPGRPEGSRLVSLRVGGTPVDPDRVYRVATNDFMARGSDGYAMFGGVRPLLPADDSPLLANEVMVYLRRIGTVRTGVEGRIVAR